MRDDNTEQRKISDGIGMGGREWREKEKSETRRGEKSQKKVASGNREQREGFKETGKRMRKSERERE